MAIEDNTTPVRGYTQTNEHQAKWFASLPLETQRSLIGVDASTLDMVFAAGFEAGKISSASTASQLYVARRFHDSSKWSGLYFDNGGSPFAHVPDLATAFHATSIEELLDVLQSKLCETPLSGQAVGLYSILRISGHRIVEEVQTNVVPIALAAQSGVVTPATMDICQALEKLMPSILHRRPFLRDVDATWHAICALSLIYKVELPECPGETTGEEWGEEVWDQTKSALARLKSAVSDNSGSSDFTDSLRLLASITLQVAKNSFHRLLAEGFQPPVVEGSKHRFPLNA